MKKSSYYFKAHCCLQLPFEKIDDPRSKVEWWSIGYGIENEEGADRGSLAINAGTGHIFYFGENVFSDPEDIKNYYAECGMTTSEKSREGDPARKTSPPSASRGFLTAFKNSLFVQFLIELFGFGKNSNETGTINITEQIMIADSLADFLDQMEKHTSQRS